jgi:hypothetical protein
MMKCLTTPSEQVPTRDEAEACLSKARARNPGPWVQHSIYVAQAAEAIATHHPTLDPEIAYVLGYLHDIGRRVGVTDMRHIIDGYTFLKAKGWDAAARICLTHSFIVQDVRVAAGRWDCSEAEIEFVKAYLAQIEYTEYDRLIQLGDALVLASGFCLIEKRLMDVALRHGLNDYTLIKWRATLRLQQRFEEAIGQSVYDILPGVIENTFAFRLKIDRG